MRRTALIAGLWLAVVAIAALIVARAQYSTDLSAFLPAAPDVRQQLLVKLLRDGPTSQLLLLAITGADVDRRTQLSQALARRLRAEPSLTLAVNGEESGFLRDRELLFRQRYAFSAAITPERFTVAGLTRAMQENLAQLGGSLGLLGGDLLARDPTGETQQVIEQLAPDSLPATHGGVWVSADSTRAVLMVRTAAAGSDSESQERALTLIRSAFAAVNAAPPPGLAPAALAISGPSAFAAEARIGIQGEVRRLSIISTLLIGSLLLLVYRSPRLLLLGFLPVVSGALVGVAAVALHFHVVYGITLGFGITLIGEAVDYSVYLFLQSANRGGGGAASADWSRSQWPTVRLGVLTSICGFASLVPAAFPGLAQLGLYSVAGLLMAAWVTRFVLPALLPAQLSIRSLAGATRALVRALPLLRRGRAALGLLALLAVLVLWQRGTQLWNRELNVLSPVPAQAQALDGQLRADLGAADVRSLVIVTAADFDAALDAAGQVSERLATLVARGEIAGYDSPSRYLPGLAQQQRRRASLPDADTLRQRVAAAADAAGLRAGLLQPFLRDVEAARQATPLRRADFAGSSLAAALDALLVPLGGQWCALLPLQSAVSGPHAGRIDADSVRAAIGSSAGAGAGVTVLDLKDATDALYGQYLHGAIRLSLLALAAITLLLLVALRSPRRCARVLLPLALAAMVVAAGFALAQRELTILHLIGLLLIFAIGSNYALFFERHALAGTSAGDSATLASLLVANLTTVIAFALLASSSMPVLAALGATVAPGAFLSLLFAAMLARDDHAAGPTAISLAH